MQTTIYLAELLNSCSQSSGRWTTMHSLIHNTSRKQWCYSTPLLRAEGLYRGVASFCALPTLSWLCVEFRWRAVGGVSEYLSTCTRTGTIFVFVRGAEMYLGVALPADCTAMHYSPRPGIPFSCALSPSWSLSPSSALITSSKCCLWNNAKLFFPQFNCG